MAEFFGKLGLGLRAEDKPMRRDQLIFWVGLCTASLGTCALLVDRVVFGADLVDASLTPHSFYFSFGIAMLLAGAGALVLAFMTDS